MKAVSSDLNRDIRSLQRRIGAVRAKRTSVVVATGIAMAVTAFVGGFATEMLLDFAVNFPWLVRALFFLATVGGTGFLVWRDVVKPFKNRPSDDAVAAMVERALPKFRTRFIASIQLARNAGPKPSGLIRALVAETVAAANVQNFREVVKTDKLKRMIKIAAGVIVATVALGWLAGPTRTPLLLKRALLLNVPFPTRTQILTVTGGKRIGAGEDLRIEATVTGIFPDKGIVTAITASGQKRQFTLEPEPNEKGKYSALLKGSQESFEYAITLNDATSEKYQIEVLPRPAIAAVRFQQIFPQYLNLPPMTRGTGDLKLLAGSTLNLDAESSMNLSKAELRLAGLETSIPLTVDPANPKKLSGSLKIPDKDLTGISIHLVSTEGVESGESAVYPVDLVPDREPSVKITYPERREELATVEATTRIAFEATDDFGISKAELHYSVDNGEEKVIEFDLGTRRDAKVTRRFDWKLSSIKPKPLEGSAVDYWITVFDTNSVTGPSVATTERNQVRIVSVDEKRLDMANQLGDTMGGLSEIATSQDELTKTLGEVIFTRTPQ